MIIIPFDTDAPINHAPIGTLALIATNVAVYAACCIDPTLVDSLVLPYDGGFHPVAWITSAFAHASLGHLVGNLIFLLAFGLVIEGRVGTPGFLGIFATLAASHGLVQNVFYAPLSSASGSLGASGVIFGLMAIAIIWCPRNEVSCFFFLFLIPWVISVPIYGLALFYIILDLVVIGLVGLDAGTSVLHVLGALVGAGVGLVPLKAKLIDAEGWDLFSLLRHGRPQRDDALEGLSARDEARIEAAEQRFLTKSRREGASRLAAQLDADDVDAAVATLRATGPDLGQAMTEWELRKMIAALRDRGAIAETVPLMRTYVARVTPTDPAAADRMHLLLARTLVDDLRRPACALTTLAELDLASGSPLAKLHVEIARRAHAMYRSGEGKLELADEVQRAPLVTAGRKKRRPLAPTKRRRRARRVEPA